MAKKRFKAVRRETVARPRKIWRMAMREGNRGPSVWPQCRQHGVAAICYSPLDGVDLSKYEQGEPKGLWDELKPAQRGFLWKVAYEMNPGDVIYVKEGMEIVGRGTVIGPYQFDYEGRIVGSDDLPWFQHQVPVGWEPDFTPVRILLGSEPSTVLELKGERLRRLEAAVRKAGGSTSMAENVYLLTWNPRRSWTEEDYRSHVRKTRNGEPIKTGWSCGNTRSVVPGDRILFLRQARDRGLIGAGFATSRVYGAPHWDREKKGQEALYVDCRFEVLLGVEERLPTETLKEGVPQIPWDRIFTSGFLVRGTAASKLLRLWNSHLAGLGWPTSSGFTLPDEVSPARQLREGATQTISVNYYERNPAARQACIEHYGFNCAVCELNFADVYGELGERYIHVHHLRDLATIGEEYEVDPVEDLRPVCPNCHAMLHRNTPVLSVDQLKGTIAAQMRRARTAHRNT